MYLLYFPVFFLIQINECCFRAKMGQDQSKGDGASRQFHPKFQNIKATGNSGATSSKTSIPSTSRATIQNDETGISSFAPSEAGRHFPIAATSHKPISQTEKSNDDTSVSSSDTRNQTIYPTSQSSTVTNNLRHEDNSAGTSTSRTREVEPSTSREQFPKAVPFSGKLHTPMRDVRHVPSYNEQIRLNSASTGNPFLSPNFDDNKPENKSNIQIDSKDNLSLDPKTFLINERLEKLYSSGVLERMDLDEIALKTLHNLSLEDALDVINLFVKSNPKTKINKSAYLCSIIKHNINNQDVGDNKTFGQNEESRGSLSPNVMGSMHFSSQNKSTMYANHIQTSPTKSNNIFGERDKQTDMKIQQSSTAPFIPELLKENQSPLNDPIFDKNDRNNENKEIEKSKIHTLNTTENAHFSNEYMTKTFEPNPSTTFGLRTPVTKSSRMASKVKTQFKRNVSKSHHPVKLSTLDKLAENICSFKQSSQTNENIFSKINTSPNISVVDTKDKFTALSFEDCLKEMKNIKFQPQEKLDFLQSSVYSNVKVMNHFITGLKSFPLLNDQIISEINILQENIISFTKDTNTLCSNSNVFSSVSNQRTWADSEKSHPPSRVSPYNIKCMDHEIEYSSSNIPLLTSDITEEAKETKCTSNTVTSLQSSISLAERLDQLQIERDKSTHFDPLKNKDINTFELGQNHQNILDVVYSSCENNYTINTIYICLPCDAYFSDQNGIVEHIKQHQIEKAKWHSCETCALVIYGTDAHYQIHCSSEKHHNIMRIKRKKSFINEDVTKQNEWDEQEDDVSVTSSKGERKNPHEILLMIAKQLKDKNKINGTVGLYCRVCNKYYRFKNYKHGSQLHIEGHLRSKSNKYNIMPCSTCHVELFGEHSLLYEHENMEIHKELAVMRKKNVKTEHNTNICFEYQISDEEGPHYELMNKVLKNYLDNEKSNNTLGYYCHLCQTYTLDEKQWRIHVNSSSHSYKINSPDCARKKMFNVCLICNIHLICDENVFTLHEQSLAHDLVVRLQNSRRSNLIGAQSVNDDEESEDTDDDSEVDKYSDSLSTTSSNHDTNKNNGVPIGIKVTGN